MTAAAAAMSTAADAALRRRVVVRGLARPPPTDPAWRGRADEERDAAYVTWRDREGDTDDGKKAAEPRAYGCTAFACPACGARRCTYVQVQTRSADEAMTVFCTCLECDRRWRA